MAARYVLVIETKADPGLAGLRRLLKCLIRAYGYVCVSIRREP